MTHYHEITQMLLKKTHNTKPLSLLSFKGTNILGRFSAILYKGDNFCDFLLASLHTKPLPRGAHSSLLEKTPFQKGIKSM